MSSPFQDGCISRGCPNYNNATKCASGSKNGTCEREKEEKKGEKKKERK